ncbi:MmcQ/YjbR family DNA-binding protein [Tenacibaculum sp. UWU-22]|uniref:MmcQ/YjbR family DNA-binding protein n=1 Tax=Tenacibaculum sp. UWU-22 TaxID=3234187 RepID=UPI0034DB6F71
MHIDELREYCIQKKGVTEHFPFDQVTLVFKVMGKMFVLVGLEKWEQGETTVNLKCNPDWAIELRENYQSIKPGYHMNKKHWNTIVLNSNDINDAFAFELIDHSYDLVVSGLTQKDKEAFKKL